MYYETRKIYIAKLLRVCIDAWLLLFTVGNEVIDIISETIRAVYWPRVNDCRENALHIDRRCENISSKAFSSQRLSSCHQVSVPQWRKS